MEDVIFCSKCAMETRRYKNGKCGCCAYQKRLVGLMNHHGKPTQKSRADARKIAIQRELDYSAPPDLTPEGKKKKKKWQCKNCGNTRERWKSGACAPCARSRKKRDYVSTRNLDAEVLKKRQRLAAENRARQLEFEADPRKATLGRKRDSVKLAEPPWLTPMQKGEIQSKYYLSRWVSNKTGVKHAVDHIVPLNHPDVCGLHVPWNLQVIPFEVNQNKLHAPYTDPNDFEPEGPT